MEDEKLQRLHDTLSKLIPRGKVGGLGLSAFNKQSSGKKRDDGLPDNALYRNFVRAGHGGQYHRRKFDADTAEDAKNADVVPSEDQKKKKKKKKSSVDLENIEDESAVVSVKLKKKTKNKEELEEELISESSSLFKTHDAEDDQAKSKKKKRKNQVIVDFSETFLDDDKSVHVRKVKRKNKEQITGVDTHEEADPGDPPKAEEEAPDLNESSKRKKKKSKKKKEEEDDPIAIEEIVSMPELNSCLNDEPKKRKIMKIFDQDADGDVDSRKPKKTKKKDKNRGDE